MKLVGILAVFFGKEKMSKKVINVMAEYSATPLWHGNGQNYSRDEIEQLDLPYWLKKQLYAWSYMYETNDSYLDTPKENFDMKYFNDMGFAIANKVKFYLPDYKVLYFDEILVDYKVIE